MSSKSISQSLSGIASAPNSHSATATGNSPASSLSSALVTDYTTKKVENSHEYPILTHRLSFTALMSLFKTIITPLVEDTNLWRLNSNGNSAALDTLLDSIAYECVATAYTVMYYKASRISVDFLQLFGPTATIHTPNFPAYCAALISTIGPVQFTGVPARGIHIPYLKWSDIAVGCPAAWAPHHTALFKEQIGSFVAMASVDTTVLESSPWWTFHAYPTNESTEEHASYSLYSPVSSDECDEILRLGVLFARQKLTVDVGVINHSATPYYPVEDPDRRDAFPAQSKEPPYFIKNQPAYYEFVESCEVIEHEAGYPPAVAESSSAARTKQCKVPASTYFAMKRAIVLYRRVYHYFDHIAVVRAEDNRLSSWAGQLNEHVGSYL